MSLSYALRDIRTLVRNHAPVVYFHDDDPYLPSSVEWFLERATLATRSGERVPLAGGGTSPQDRLPIWDGPWPFPNDVTEKWLEVPETALAGDLSSAVTYVFVRQVKDGFIDIMYWFWYPGNGGGTARLKALAFDSTVVAKDAVSLAPLGFHVSDWERVTVRVTDDAPHAIVEVYFAQHAGGRWLKPQDLERGSDGRLIVYSSRNGHASYPHAGPNPTQHIKTTPPGAYEKVTPSALEFWLRNDTQRGSRTLDCAARHEIVSVQAGLLASDEPPFDEPRWLSFPYRWGPETEQKLTHEAVFQVLQVAIGPLLFYGAFTVGAGLTLLGVVAGLLLPFFLKLENENGKPGPKQKVTSPDWSDKDSGPEPANLFHDAVSGGVGGLVSWVEGAGRDVASRTTGAASSVADWTTGAANDVASWTTGAGIDTADWFKDAGNDVASWTTGAANDVADWTKGAADDVGKAVNPWNW